MIKIKTLLDLYLIFLKIGGFTFGSGYAMLPMIRQEFCEKRNLINQDEISDFIVFAQSLPGLISINISCAIGKKIAGIKGAIISAIGVITLPSIIIILIANYFSDIIKFSLANKIIASMQCVTVAIIFLAFMQIYKSNIKYWFERIIFLSGVILAIFFKMPTQYIILFSCVLNLIYKKILLGVKK